MLTGRAVMTAIVAIIFSSVVAVGPASASTPGAQWQAKVGSRGINGTATVSIATSGAATISVSLKGLVPKATYSESLFLGTCSVPSTRIAALPTLRTTASGTFARTNTLTAAAAALVNEGDAVIRLVSGSHVSCGVLARQAGAAIVTTCDQPHLAVALATGGTVRFACDATITLASTIAVTKPVVLDATDHAVGIDGGGAVGLFSVRGGVSFGIVNLTLQNGSSAGPGGAIDASNGGPVSISSSTIIHNQGSGRGAIAAAGQVTVSGSTFVGNVTVGSGGGGTLGADVVSVTNSTFAGNQGGPGGVIHAIHGLSSQNSTFVGDATAGTLVLDQGTATLQNTILSGGGPDCQFGAAGAFTLADQGGNLGTDGSCGFSAASSRNGVPVAALALAPLADNGGPTQTVALLPGSLAIDAGAACPPPSTDQRGVPRPQGAACDAGAFEVEPPPGYDISFPQCGSPYPASPAFGIVGVNGGRALSANPCLGAGALPSELAWAGGTTAQLYANTGNPGPALSTHWPDGQASPRACNTATAPGADTPDCAYDYGWNAAADSYQTAVLAYISLGLAPAGATRTPAANAWWLDVEIGNSWRSTVALNVAALQGEFDYLQSVGVASIGFYSTWYQWNQITGGTKVFAAAPSWVAGVMTTSGARASCNGSGFTGGPVVMAQYAANGFDADWRC